MNEVEGPGRTIATLGAFGFWGHDDRRDEPREQLAASQRIGLEEREKVFEVASNDCRVGDDRWRLRPCSQPYAPR